MSCCEQCLPEGEYYYSKTRPRPDIHTAGLSQDELESMVMAKWKRWYHSYSHVQLYSSWMGTDDVRYGSYSRVELRDLASRPHVLEYWDGAPSVIWLDGMHTNRHGTSAGVVRYEEIKAR